MLPFLAESQWNFSIAFCPENTAGTFELNFLVVAIYTVVPAGLNRKKKDVQRSKRLEASLTYISDIYRYVSAVCAADKWLWEDVQTCDKTSMLVIASYKPKKFF